MVCNRISLYSIKTSFLDSKQAMKELNILSHEIRGGGDKVTSTIFKRLEDNVVLQDMKGGVKLDSIEHRDRL